MSPCQHSCPYSLYATQKQTIQDLTERVKELLEGTHPNGPEFTQTVFDILQRENNWVCSFARLFPWTTLAAKERYWLRYFSSKKIATVTNFGSPCAPVWQHPAPFCCSIFLSSKIAPYGLPKFVAVAGFFAAKVAPPVASFGASVVQRKRRAKCSPISSQLTNDYRLLGSAIIVSPLKSNPLHHRPYL